MGSVKTFTVYFFQTIIIVNKTNDFLDGIVFSNDTLFHSKEMENIEPKIKEKLTVSPIHNILHLSTINIVSTHQQEINHDEELDNSPSIDYQNDNQIITSSLSENPEIMVTDSLSNKSNGNFFFLLKIFHHQLNYLISPSDHSMHE